MDIIYLFSDQDYTLYNSRSTTETGKRKPMMLVGSETVKIYKFLKTKQEEEEETLGISLVETENGGSLKLGFSLGTTLGISSSDLSSKQNKNCKEGLVDFSLKNKWFSQIGEKCCSPPVESESMSVFQRSSEGEYDPNASFETGNNSSQFDLSRIIDLNVDAHGDEEQVSAALQTNSECSFMDGNFRETSLNEENVPKKQSIQEGFEKKTEHPRGGLDLLLDAINLTNGGLLEGSEAKEDTCLGVNKKKRVRKNQFKGPKCKKGKLSNEKVQANHHDDSCDEQGSETITEQGKSNEFDWHAEYADTSPLVRSKRGRNQALPARFRDSLIDPWKRISRPKTKPIVMAEP